MKSQRHEKSDKIFQLFQAALELDQDERAAFLDRECQGDEEMRREVEALLAYDQRAENFIESPAFEDAPELLADNEGSSTLTMDAVGPFKLIKKLGSGGMGEVYLARDSRLGRNVALKLLDRNLIGDSGSRSRFLREARLASALDHPNICTIHEIGEASGLLFIAMQYIEGETLKEVIASQPLALDCLLSISLQVSNALAAAHAHGIIHRDIKSSNIIVTPGGQAKVLDFGLAKPLEREDDQSELTHAGAVMGTPTYMSPEQARGERADHRSDIFSFGVVMYEMATGRTPFKSKSRAETMNAVINQPHTPVAELNKVAAPELCAVIDKALAKQADDRYQSIGDMKNELRRVAQIAGMEKYNSSDPLIVPYVPPLSSGRRARKRGSITQLWQVTAAALVVLILAAFIYVMFFRTASSLSGGGIKSLAVLPMENLSGDASQDYFADGMTDALITNLAKINALQVISRPAVMRYKGAQKPLREIGHELNVDAVLTSSVVRSGERVRIGVQLIHAATDRNLWADSYERDMRDVLSLQREVAGDIASEIRIKLSPQEREQLASTRPVNPEAYDQYLRGRYYANRQNKDDNETAIISLERAVDLDPTFASAYAELAQAYVWKLVSYAPLERQWEEKAFVATEKALSLDPNLGVAHLARGLQLWTPANHFAHEKAIREFRRALDLNPNLDVARSQLATIYLHIGAFDEALQEAQKAIATNPNNNPAQIRIGETLSFQGRYEQGLAGLRSIPGEVNPVTTGHHIVWALFKLGRKQEASATLEQLVRDHPEDSGGVFASLQAVLAASAGQERIAEDQIKRAEKKGKGFMNFHHTAYNIACAYALMNKREQAIKWLEVAAEEGFPCYPLFERDANLDNLRQDARFVSFMTKLKQQWEHYRTLL